MVCSAMGATPLESVVQTIAKVSQAWDDVLLHVEPAVDDRSIDVHVGMMPFDEGHALGRRDNTDDPYRVSAGPPQQVERRNSASAGGQHRIDDQNVARVEPRGELRVVLRRHRRQLIALEADVPDTRVGYEIEHGIE